MKGYEKIIEASPRLRFRRPLTEAGLRDSLRLAIHVWIAEDLGVAAQMTIMPEMVDKLIDRLTVED